MNSIAHPTKVRLFEINDDVQNYKWAYTHT